MTYIKPLLLSVTEFQNSRFPFVVSKLFLIPSAFAFCKAERKDGKPLQTVLSTTEMSNVQWGLHRQTSREETEAPIWIHSIM